MIMEENWVLFTYIWNELGNEFWNQVPVPSACY